ncbi:DUF4279 domain-containing protein [Dyadobacter pollutisoli]|jgi:hypothetical protein|uniref:DUF4279 domain-containing protein n=1 Tax=Dyadobacter pollutisoli TaxID=2910158 RepID=A0A9E8NFP1_9BACT|nr:DUF4279 domain-containing protein [Dyadobacter pollutisoli]WAC14443.1 DUF4279 domain-containing protein [Dyadobacter pollutisoli]
MDKNEIHLSFCIWGFKDITHDKLSKILEIAPSKIFIEGERMNPKFSQLAKENGWFLDASTDKFTPFEQQMDSILDLLTPKVELLKPICDIYYCEFSLALFINNNEESTPSVHLSSRYHDLAKELRFEFDLDLYCLQNA